MSTVVETRAERTAGVAQRVRFGALVVCVVALGAAFAIHVAGVEGRPGHVALWVMYAAGVVLVGAHLVRTTCLAWGPLDQPGDRRLPVLGHRARHLFRWCLRVLAATLLAGFALGALDVVDGRATDVVGNVVASAFFGSLAVAMLSGLVWAGTELVDGYREPRRRP